MAQYSNKMGIPNYPRSILNRLFSKLGLITEKDFNAIEGMHTTTNFNVGIVETGAHYINNWALALKSFYIARFKYEGYKDTDIDIPLIENYLWTWGRVAVVKFGGKCLIGGFKIKGVDYNNNITKIVFFPISSYSEPAKKRKPLAKTFTVGKDCVVIQANTGFWLNNKFIYSPFLRTNPLLHELFKVRQQLFNNLYTSRSVIGVPYGASKKLLEEINDALYSGSPIVKLGDNFRKSNAGATSVQKAELFDFTDRTAQLIEMHNHLWEEVQSLLGIRTNANANKKERQISSEIDVNNALSDKITESSLIYREKALKILNKIFGTNITVEIEKTEEETDETANEQNSANTQSTN